MVHMLDRMRGSVEVMFERWARFIAGHPWKVILSLVIINTLFGLQLISLVPNNDILSLYIAHNTDATRTRDMLMTYFTDDSSNNFLPNSSLSLPLYAEFIVSKTGSGNILTENALQEISNLIQEVMSINATSRYDEAINYWSVCARNQGACVTEGLTDKEIDYLGDANVINGSITSATYRKIRFYLRKESPNRLTDSARWMEKFLQYFDNYSSRTLQVVYSHSLSFFVRLNDDTYIDIRYFGLVFTALVTYCSFMITGGDCLSKRTHLGRMGVIVVPLSVMGAWGFLAGCGAEFTNMNGMMPFVALFVEINSMLLLLARLSENTDDHFTGTSGYKARVSKSVKEASFPTLSLYLAIIVPFGFGMLSKYKAFEIFSLYTVTTFTFMFINHMTFFIACLTVHEKRIDDSRHCCTCAVITTPDDPEVQDRSGCFRCCCTGKKPTSPKSTESIFERVPRKLLTRFVLTTVVKIISLLVLIGFTGCGIWQMVHVHTGLYREEDVKAGTHFHDFHQINKLYFPQKSFVTFCPEEIDVEEVKDNEDSDSSDDDEYKLPYLDISNIKVFETVMKNYGDKFPPSDNVWLKVYSESDMYDDSSEQAFVEGLKVFLSENERFKDDIVFTDDGAHIFMYRFLLQANAVPNSDAFVDLRNDINDDDDLKDFKLISYSPEFRFVDSLKPCLLELIRFYGIQLAMLLLAVLFYPDKIRCVFEVSIWYVICIIGTLAYTGIIGVFITSVSVILYMISMSYFTTVIVFSYHTFSISEGGSAPVRVHNVLNATTPHLFSTSFASLLGLMIMFVEESFVFITIFKVLVISVGITLLLSCFFIPTVMSFTGTGKTMDSSVKQIAEVDVAAVLANNVAIEVSEEKKQGAEGSGIVNFGYDTPKDIKLSEKF